jgi:hypothetical protein
MVTTFTMLPESYPTLWECAACECVFAEMMGHRLERERKYCPECGRKIIAFALSMGLGVLHG